MLQLLINYIIAHGSLPSTPEKSPNSRHALHGCAQPPSFAIDDDISPVSSTYTPGPQTSTPSPTPRSSGKKRNINLNLNAQYVEPAQNHSTPEKNAVVASNTDCDAIALGFEKLGITGIEISRLTQMIGKMHQDTYRVVDPENRIFFVKSISNHLNTPSRTALLASDRVKFDPWNRCAGKEPYDLKTAYDQRNIFLQDYGFVPVLGRFKDETTNLYYEVSPYLTCRTVLSVYEELLLSQSSDAHIKRERLIEKVAIASAKFTNYLRQLKIKETAQDSHPDGHLENYVMDEAENVYVIDCRLYNDQDRYTASEKIFESFGKRINNVVKNMQILYGNAPQHAIKNWYDYTSYIALNKFINTYNKNIGNNISDINGMMQKFYPFYNLSCAIQTLDINLLVENPPVHPSQLAE